MASDFLKRKAEEAAKRIDEKYGKGAYGGSAWRDQAEKGAKSVSQKRTASVPASSYAAAYGAKKNEDKKPAASSYAAISDISNPETAQKVKSNVQKAAENWKEKRGAPFWEDMFAQDRNYVDLARQGDLPGAAANFIGTGLQSLQSLYLNAWNAGDALISGEKPEFQYNLDKAAYDKIVAGRHGDGQSIGEKISDKNKALGMVYGIANEALSDPTEFIAGGMFNDMAKAAGSAKAGSTGYAKALQSGALAGVPKTAGAAAKAVDDTQEAAKTADKLDTLPDLAKPGAAADAAKTTDAAKAADTLTETEKRIADARRAAERELEEATANYRQYYAEYRSTTPETRRAGLLQDAADAKSKMNAAQEKVNGLLKQGETLAENRAAQEAAAKAAEQERHRITAVRDIADSMDLNSVHKRDLDALEEIGETNPMIAAMRQNYRMAEQQQGALYGLYKQLDEADSLNDALKIQEQIAAAEKKLDQTRGILDRAEESFRHSAQGAAQTTDNTLLSGRIKQQAEQMAENAAEAAQETGAAMGFHEGERVWAADRNNYGVVQGKNASGTYDVLFVDSRTGKNKVVELSGDTIQAIDPTPPRPALDELPDIKKPGGATEEAAEQWRRVWPPEDAAEAARPVSGMTDETEKMRVAAKHADEADPRELRDAKALVSEIDYEMQSGLEKLPGDTFWRLKDPGKSAYNKDLSRVLDAVAGKDTKLREVLRKYIERPIMEAKNRYSHNVKNKLDQYFEATKELGIKQGSRESAAVQWYGEGYRRIRAEGHLEEIPYTLNDMKRDFPDTWQNIQRMDGINRKIYNDYVERLNAALSKIYPNVEENARQNLTILKAQRDGLQNKVRALQEGLEAAPGSADYAAELQTFMQRVQDNDKEINSLQRAIETGEIYQNKRVLPRKDYYHHWQEMDDGFSAIKNIFQTSADIDPRLVGVSDWTKPKGKWAGFMQARKGFDSAEDSVGGMVKYIQAAEYKINIDPEIARLRVTVRDLQNGTAETRNANTFIEWLTNYANDLAGKTNPLDRGIQTTVIGRKAMKGLRWLNNRVKGNAVMGNLSSVVSQVYNLPNAVANIKNPVDLAAGLTDAVKVSAGSKDAKNLLSQSGFMTERYLDKAVRQFDEGILKAPGKFASWLMEIGDRKVAELSWFAAYRQAERRGMKNAVEYADDLTRRAVAGRGIGEIPLNQKSEIMKLIAPFQVEVNNAYQLLKEKFKQKDALALVELFGTTWLMNEVRKNYIDGRETGFDPIHAAQDVYEDISAEEVESGEKMPVLNQIGRYGGRLAGEFLSNIPAGDQIARTVLGLDETTAENLFGEGDPTRFGTGNIGLSAISAPIANFLTGKQVDYLEPITNIALPFGGAQATRTRKAAEDLDLIPKLRMNMNDGFTMREQPTAAAYTADNSRVKYLIDRSDPMNVAKGLMFGSTATKDGQAYLAGGNKMLSAKDTKSFDALMEFGHEPRETYDVIRAINGMTSEKDADGKTVETSTAKARKYIMGLDLDQRGKQELDRFIIAGTELDENGKAKRIPDYSSESELLAFNTLSTDGYDKATQANREAGIAYDTFVNVYKTMRSIDEQNKSGELGNRSVSDAKRGALASMDIEADQKSVLEDLLINNRKPTSYADFGVADLSEAAQNKWNKAKAAGFTEREFGDVWRTIGKYTKTKDRLSAVVALGYPEADAEFFVKLYTEKSPAASGDWKLPVTPGDGVWISSQFGTRDAPTAGASSDHPAIDIAASAGEPVFAAKSGIVTAVNKRGYGDGYGTWVQIDHGDGYATQYSHMAAGSADGLNVGDIVKAGQEVGLVGSTGASTGPHLDFKMWKNGQIIDPLTEIYY